MTKDFDCIRNTAVTRDNTGYVPRKGASPEVYARLGFKCGLEIHQQLRTEKKLFCRCPAGIYHADDEFDAEVIRHMRPTLSELGEYDGTALMEFKTRKNIIYRINNKTACTYEIDDTPPFPINRQALEQAIAIALLLQTNIVGELHITRKQYLDGSIPTGFQRTAIVGINGEIPLRNKKVGIIQLSVEEDACREVSDVGHWRIYKTDRLGMPLIEMVTYPDMKTPDEAGEAGHYLRFLARSSGRVRTGIGAARQDVNVSIEGGRRVEIKGVAHIAWIPELTHNEAFRQRALLLIKEELHRRIADPDTWRVRAADIDLADLATSFAPILAARAADGRLTAVNLPSWRGLLSHFTQTGQVFADELAGKIKVVACLEHPNMLHSESPDAVLPESGWQRIREVLQAAASDAQVLLWGPARDVATAVETIEERCRLAFDGVPNETRKSRPDGTTIFERVLPGPDRMYPDTDSAPIPIAEEDIEKVRRTLPPSVHERLNQFREWQIPEDCFTYLLRRNLAPVIEKIIADAALPARFVGTLFGHRLRHVELRLTPDAAFDYHRVYDLAVFAHESGLERDILSVMTPVAYQHPNMTLESVLTTVGFRKMSADDILAHVPILSKKYDEIGHCSEGRCRVDWIMGRLRKLAVGNMPLPELRRRVEAEVARG